MPATDIGRQIDEAKRFIASRVSVLPEIGIILGSGLGVLTDAMDGATVMLYEQIPHFPVPTVSGHAGELWIGEIAGKPTVLMKGRFHLYEGHSPATVAFPIRVMKAIGVRTLVVTNAAGGINDEFRPGDLMLIRDHINFMFRNPLIGPNDPELGPRFPDMSEPYSASLREIARQTAAELGIRLQEGVYCGMLGPTYETPAEIRMLRALGADAVGMSTVPEVIAARHAELQVLGISCISNMAAGITAQPLSHAEVIETAERVKKTFMKLITGVVAKL